MDTFLGSSQNWIIFSGHKSRYIIGDIFHFGCQNFKYFLGVLEIPDIFWGVNGRCWAPSLRMKKKREYPPGANSYYNFDGLIKCLNSQLN